MSEITQEEVLAQLKTRGFESGFQRTPLRDFWGTLDSITGTMEKRGEAPEERLYVLYNFSDVEVIKSTEPYVSPVAQIEIPHSNRKQSGMGVFGGSIDKLINADLPEDMAYDTLGLLPEDTKGQDYLITKRIHMVMTGGHMMWDGREKKEVARECWEVTEVQGEESVEEAPPEPKLKPQATKAAVKVAVGKASKPTKPISAAQAALKELDGKTEQQFYQAVFNNALVKADGALVSSIINREFIQPLLDAGSVTLDDDNIYHVA